jgi:hypothetical protein
MHGGRPLSSRQSRNRAALSSNLDYMMVLSPVSVTLAETLFSRSSSSRDCPLRSARTALFPRPSRAGLAGAPPSWTLMTRGKGPSKEQGEAAVLPRAAGGVAPALTAAAAVCLPGGVGGGAVQPPQTATRTRTAPRASKNHAGRRVRALSARFPLPLLQRGGLGRRALSRCQRASRPLLACAVGGRQPLVAVGATERPVQRWRGMSC